MKEKKERMKEKKRKTERKTERRKEASDWLTQTKRSFCVPIDSIIIPYHPQLLVTILRNS